MYPKGKFLVKNPISFLTFSSISLSVCLVAQYLCSAYAGPVFSLLFPRKTLVIQTAFWGFAKIAQLLFGIFEAKNNSERFVNLYFFGFSQVIYIIVHVLLFVSRFFLPSVIFSAILVFFTCCCALVSQNKKRIFLAAPQIFVCVFLLILSLSSLLG